MDRGIDGSSVADAENLKGGRWANGTVSAPIVLHRIHTQQTTWVAQKVSHYQESSSNPIKKRQ